MPTLPTICPGRADWFKGFLVGTFGTALLGSWLIVSLIKGRPVLAGFLTDYNLMRLLPGFLLNGVAFGIGMGVLYAFLGGLFGLRRA